MYDFHYILHCACTSGANPASPRRGASLQSSLFASAARENSLQNLSARLGRRTMWRRAGSRPWGPLSALELVAELLEEVQGTAEIEVGVGVGEVLELKGQVAVKLFPIEIFDTLEQAVDVVVALLALKLDRGHRGLEVV